MTPLIGSRSAQSGAPAPTGPAAAERRQRLHAVAQEFESLLVSNLLKSMRDTVPESGLMEGSGDIKYYRQMYDEELARAMTKGHGGLGIADMIIRSYGGEEADPAGPAVPAPTVTSEDPGDWPLALPPAPLMRPAYAAVKRPAGPAATTPVAGVSAAGAGAVPPQASRGIAVYALAQAQAEQADPLARLRAAAAREGGAVADSLRRFEPEIARAAADTGVDPALLLSVMVQESGGDPRARSRAGAVGLMQLLPGTAAEMGVAQPLHPGQNVMGGARYLARMLDRFDRSVDLALAGYNAGPGAVERNGGRVPPYRETRAYVARVNDLYDRLRESAGTSLARDGAEQSVGTNAGERGDR